MSEFYSFLLKANVALFVLGAIYYLFLKRETFFGWNRTYLWVAGAFTFLVPLVPTWSGEANTGTATVFPVLELPALTTSATTAVEADVSGLVWTELLAIILLSVTALFLVILAAAAIRLYFLKLRYPAKVQGDHVVVTLPSGQDASSFFRWIFLAPEDAENRKIVQHELAHVRHRHSLDLIFWQIVRAVFWFNPMAWMMLREVRTLHEFIADQEVTEESDRQDYSLLLLGRAMGAQPSLLVNSFSHQTLIKQRIMMLHKLPSKANARRKYWAVPTAIMALVLLASCTKDFDEKQQTNATPATTAVASNDVLPKDELTEVDEMAQFDGGQEAMFAFFAEHFKYPQSAKDAGIEGVTYISFVVDETGLIKDVTVKKGFDDACDQQAVEFIAAMPAWIPGKKDGKAVSSVVTLPIRYKLE